MRKKKQDWTFILLGAGLLSLAIFIYLLTRKKKKQAIQQAVVPTVADPFREALEQLRELWQADLPGKGETKGFYTRLTGIFRTYVEKRKGIQSQQQTTDDLVVQLKGVNLNTEQYNQLSQALRLSDFVKFAKYVPTEADNKNVFDTVKKSIEEIERLKPPPPVVKE